MHRYLAVPLIPLLACACSVWTPMEGKLPDQSQHCVEDLRQVKNAPGAELPETIHLVNWNLQKGSQPGWESQLRALSRHHDLLLIQEAVAGGSLAAPLASHKHRHFAPGYHTGSQQTGVLTASRVAPASHCNLSSTEPWLGTPKATAITRFALKNSAQQLLVANIHGVNFSLGIEEYRRQLAGVVAVLSAHAGPIIFAGDFNTWNGRRLDLLRQAAQKLSLTAVTFTEDKRKRFLGKPLDHILVRGLVPVASRAPHTTSSDHSPLLVSLSRSPVRRRPGQAAARYPAAMQ